MSLSSTVNGEVGTVTVIVTPPASPKTTKPKRIF